MGDHLASFVWRRRFAKLDSAGATSTGSIFGDRRLNPHRAAEFRTAGSVADGRSTYIGVSDPRPATLCARRQPLALKDCARKSPVIPYRDGLHGRLRCSAEPTCRWPWSREYYHFDGIVTPGSLLAALSVPSHDVDDGDDRRCERTRQLLVPRGHRRVLTIARHAPAPERDFSPSPASHYRSQAPPDTGSGSA